MHSAARTVAAYLKSLPLDRRAALSAVRKVLKAHLPKGYKETMQYGMIGYVVPLSLYPAGYHARKGEPLPFASLASQKNHMALYLMCVYGDHGAENWLKRAFAARGKKLDMGKACIRFKSVDDLPLDVVSELVAGVPVAAFIEKYERAITGNRRAERSKRRPTKNGARKQHSQNRPVGRR